LYVTTIYYRADVMHPGEKAITSLSIDVFF